MLDYEITEWPACGIMPRRYREFSLVSPCLPNVGQPRLVRRLGRHATSRLAPRSAPASRVAGACASTALAVGSLVSPLEPSQSAAPSRYGGDVLSSGPTSAFSIVLILGAPRSGTTWLQRLMAAHESVASSQETDLLDAYVGCWADNWQRHLPEDDAVWQTRRHKGLPAVLTADEFENLLRSVVFSVYGKVAALKPTARVVLDKNPHYAGRTRLIRQLLPEARIIHMLRDGRDVAASLVAAGRSWGRDWAPRRVDRAAQQWLDFVGSVIDVDIPRDRYLEVRYEDLLADGPRILSRCLAFCGMTVDPEDCQRIYDNLPLPQMRPLAGPAANRRVDPLLWSGEVVRRLGEAPSEPLGFLGEGRSGQWRSSWNARDRWAFSEVAGDLLVQLRYESDYSWVDASVAARALFRTERLAGTALRQARRHAADMTRSRV